MKKITLLFCLCILLSCKKNTKAPILKVPRTPKSTTQYAKGLKIFPFKTHTLIEISSPWNTFSKTYKFIVSTTPNKSIKNTFDGFILSPISSIVSTSTTHIPFLELLNEEQSLIGFPNTKYISSKKIRAQIAKGKVAELGQNERLNTEKVLSLNPDLVMAFSINGTNKTLNTIHKAQIPVIYNGDWLERSPLAKAEWIKLFGVLYNKEAQADSIFNRIVANYNTAKQIAKKARTQPSILSGAMYKSLWYLPKGESTEAHFFKDANANYLWKNTHGQGSLTLDFERVYNAAKNTDLWFSPSNFKSLNALKQANPHYEKFKAFKNKTIYSFVNTIGETGGILYYESGITKPDIVLKDIIKFCHPELLPDYQPYFFKPLH